MNASENTIEQLLSKWKDLATSTAPLRKKKKKTGSIRFKNFTEKTDKEEYEPIEYSDISEFTEASTTDLTAFSDQDTNDSSKTSDDEEIDASFQSPSHRTSFKDGPPVLDNELKRELNIASIPVLKTSETGSSILSSPSLPSGSIRIRASVSPVNSDDSSSFLVLKLTLIQCQDLSSKHSSTPFLPFLFPLSFPPNILVLLSPFPPFPLSPSPFPFPLSSKHSSTPSSLSSSLPFPFSLIKMLTHLPIL